MSLSFLSKKKFHTTNVGNVEQVWLKEREKLEEERKLQELKKQIEEEKEFERVQDLQEESGIITRNLKEKSKLQWMYQGPSGINRRANTEEDDEYLNGRKTVDDFLKQNEQDEYQFNKRVTMREEQVSLENISPYLNENQNENFRRMVEDPLFTIKRRELERVERMKKNPLKVEEAKELAIISLEEKLNLSKKKSIKRNLTENSDSGVMESPKQRRRRSKHKKSRSKSRHSRSSSSRISLHRRSRRREKKRSRSKSKSKSKSKNRSYKIDEEERRQKLADMRSDGDRRQAQRRRDYHEDLNEKEREHESLLGGKSLSKAKFISEFQRDMDERGSRRNYMRKSQRDEDSL